MEFLLVIRLFGEELRKRFLRGYLGFAPVQTAQQIFEQLLGLLVLVGIGGEDKLPKFFLLPSG